MLFVSEHDVRANAGSAFYQRLVENYTKVDRTFLGLLLAQWCGSVIIALAVSPLDWNGSSSTIHIHVWLSVFLGAALALFPRYVAKRAPGKLITRLTIATAQVLFSSLFIHLSSGRMETHFHVFVSMAMLVLYRDARVFAPALLITVLDQVIRGLWWPHSFLGEQRFIVLQPLEHGFWLVLETVTLCYVVKENLTHWKAKAGLERQLREERDRLEVRVRERTEQLQSVQRFLEEILNSIDASICIIDSHGRIVFINQSWAELAAERGVLDQCGLGATYEGECGLTMLGNPEFVSVVFENVRLVATGELDSFCSEYSSEISGSNRSFRLSITPVALDGELGVAIVYVDVTHLKRAERRASALARLLLESPNEILIIDAQSNHFVEVNDGASRNSGFEREELLQMGVFDLFDLDQAKKIRKSMDSLGRSDNAVVHFESVITRQDNSEYPCHVSLHATEFEEKQVWVLFISDLTGQRELEFKLQQAQKLESLGTLAAGIAHEINTPMQCVVGNFEFLQNSFTRLFGLSDRLVELLETTTVDWQKEREELQQHRRKYRYDFLRQQTPLALEEATESSHRIVSIVRAMKAMSHPGTSDAVELDLHELIQDASIISRNRWKYVAEMSLDLSPDVPKIWGYPAELNQVFLNLFVNSADAIIERLGPSPAVLGLIAVDTQVKGRNVVIRVRDTGNGIPENVRKKIFDPFFTTKDVGKGTGQGLAITHSVICNKHGGSISVSSEVGIGTIFTIELPISKNAPKCDPIGLPLMSESIIAPNMSVN